VLALNFAGARVAATLMGVDPLNMVPNPENGEHMTYKLNFPLLNSLLWNEVKN
jgi:hypothetical protein